MTEPIKYKVLGQWRKALSITRQDDGKIHLCRFNKDLAKWQRIAFFTTEEDLEDFLGWVEEIFPPNTKN